MHLVILQKWLFCQGLSMIWMAAWPLVLCGVACVSERHASPDPSLGRL
jgi:hypothetical protein